MKNTIKQRGASRAPAVPDWAEKHPFPPSEKRPAKLLPTTLPRIYGRRPNRIPTWMHLSTDLITHAEFALPAGTRFEPPDIHAGDEVYYVLAGSVVVHQPQTGQVVAARAGHGLHIPKGTPHVAYNFQESQARVLTFFAPRIWATAEDRLALDNEASPRVIIPGQGGWNGTIISPDVSPVPPFSRLGCFPVDGPWSRTQGIITDVPPDRALHFIHGKEDRSLVKLFIANDVITLGTMRLPGNAQSDAESHPGDEVLHVITGRLSVEIGPESASAVSVPRFELSTGEKLFIPQGLTHRYDNFDSEPVEFVFAAAPAYGWGTDMRSDLPVTPRKNHGTGCSRST